MSDLPITTYDGGTPVVINDPITPANVANIKAASTAAVAADNSLVVALSPNSPLPIGSNKIGVTGVAQGSTTSGQNGDLIQGAVTTAAPTYTTGQTSPLSLTTAGALRTDSSAVIQPVSIVQGGNTASVDGSGHLQTDVNNIVEWMGSTAPTVGSKIAANSLPVVIASDQTNVPVTAAQATAANLNAQVQGPAASGATVLGNPVLIGASDGTNAQTLKVNPVNNGVESLLIQDNENLRQTYSIELSNYSIASGATDVFILIGSATKTIRVVTVQFSMTATTAVTVPIQLIKRSTANTGGTVGIAAITSWDSNNATATATNLAYQANATTLGTVVGTGVRSIKYFAPLTTTQSVVVNWDLGINNCQPVVLRGVAQSLCINLNGTTIAGGTISASFTWTEDNV